MKALDHRLAYENYLMVAIRRSGWKKGYGRRRSHATNFYVPRQHADQDWDGGRWVRVREPGQRPWMLLWRLARD